MNLKSFGVGNFKAFGPIVQKVPIRPITLVFGPNSSGKSSLLHSLLWMNHVIKNDELDVRYPDAATGKVDLGGFDQTVNDKATPRRVHVEFNKQCLPCDIRDSIGIEESVAIELVYGNPRWLKYGGAACLLDISVTVDGEEYFKAVDQGDGMKVVSCGSGAINVGQETEPAVITPKMQEVLDFIAQADTFDLGRLEKVIASRIFREINLSRSRYIPSGFIMDSDLARHPSFDESDALHDRLLSALYDVLNNDLGKLKYVPPLRELPPRYFDANGVDGEWATLIDGGQELFKKINSWLSSDSLRTQYELVIAEYVSSDSVEAGAQRFIGSLLVQTALVDDGFGSRDAPPHITSRLPKLMPELRRRYESIGPEVIIDRYPSLKEEILNEYAVGDYGDEHDPENRKFPLGTCPEYIREYSDALIDLNKYIGLEALDGETDPYYQLRFAVPVFSEWASEQPEVIDLFRQSYYHNPKDLACYLADEILVSSRDIRREIHLKDIKRGTKLSLQEVGVGVSQVLPVIISALGYKNELVAIEQPEIHIHPAFQAELGDLFIESALGDNKNTFLLETHSEHLMLRLLRRIRETTEQNTDDWPQTLREACPNGIKPEDVCVLYADLGPDGTTFKELRINELGEFIDEWPSGFFDERIQEIL